MRPTRLQMSGFTSFRDPCAIDFSDVDYFALVGPTGSGKSSVIDALCFALYGAVPRYEDRRIVAPVITQGQLEARVRLDFTLGSKSYTAVRIVRRQGRGATTKEARLESDGEVLAAGADEVTAEVERLIGLGFEHFTKCVVLPQGEFARFLHDRPAERQDMLVRLLNLGLYDHMREAARARAEQAKNRADLNQQRLSEDLAFATDQALEDARLTLKQLEGLRGRLDDAKPELARLAGESEALRESLTQSQRSLEALHALQVPAEVGRLADELAHARKLLHEAEDNLTHEKARLDEARAARAGLPERAPLAAAAAAHEQRARLLLQVEERGAGTGALEARAASARGELARAEEELAAAQEAEGAARDEHAAFHLARSLRPGGACPVCLQRVAEPPAHPAAPDLQRARAALAEASERRAEVARRAEAASSALAVAHAEVATLKDQIVVLDGQLEGYPEAGELRATLVAIEDAEARVEARRADVETARDELDRARRAMEQLGALEHEARRRLSSARDELMHLGPPPLTGDHLAEDWEALFAWAAARAESLERESKRARALAEQLVARRAALVAELGQVCRDCNLEFGDDVESAVLTRLALARAERERLEAARNDAAKLRSRIQRDKEQFEVANLLAHHLSAKGFEKWIVNEALQRLVDGASDVLRSLSADQYSLTVDDTGNFLVTDHHNADESRPARTLSGGETFLASLSLALSLSDQLAELAAQGAVRLEAIFLDEGFGSLDSEALDVVAATVENLAAGGRMVGLVTHVKDLAENVPVQLRVTKDGRSSKVERCST